MKISRLELGPLYTNCYVVSDDEEKSAVVVDAPPDSASVVADIADKRGFEISAVLLTHSHWDHAADASMFKNELDAPIYVHEKDEFRLKSPAEHSLMPLPFEIKPCSADAFVEDGQMLTFGGINLEAVHAPGHTEGGLIFLNEEIKIAFVGDIVFRGSIGRVDLPGGSEAFMKDTLINKILTLDDDYVLYPGHGEITSLGEEKKIYPFLINLLNS